MRPVVPSSVEMWNIIFTSSSYRRIAKAHSSSTRVDVLPKLGLLCSWRTLRLCLSSFGAVFSPSARAVETRWRTAKLSFATTEAACWTTTCEGLRGRVRARWAPACSTTSWRGYMNVLAIVGLLLCWDAQCTVCFRDLDEAFCCLRIIWVVVWMVDFGKVVERPT